MKAWLLSITILFTVLFSVNASAGNYPTKTVVLITNFPVGSGPDNVLRKIASELSANWKQSVIVENKPGGAGAVALGTYENTANDGHSILFSEAGLLVGYPILYNKPDALAKLEPVTGMLLSPFMLIAPPNITDLSEVKLLVQTNPSYGSWGIGSGGHLLGLELSSYLKVTGVHIPYKEYSQWFVDTSSGRLAYGFASVPSSRELQKNGKLTYLATAGAKRDPRYPDIPTMQELTKQSFVEFGSWTAFYIKSDITDDIKKKISEDLNLARSSTTVRNYITEIGYSTWEPTSLELKKFITNEKQKYKKLIDEYNIKID